MYVDPLIAWGEAVGKSHVGQPDADPFPGELRKAPVYHYGVRHRRTVHPQQNAGVEFAAGIGDHANGTAGKMQLAETHRIAEKGSEAEPRVEPVEGDQGRIVAGQGTITDHQAVDGKRHQGERFPGGQVDFAEDDVQSGGIEILPDQLFFVGIQVSIKSHGGRHQQYHCEAQKNEEPAE